MSDFLTQNPEGFAGGVGAPVVCDSEASTETEFAVLYESSGGAAPAEL